MGFEPSRETKHKLAKFQKVTEEGMNDLRPFWWPVIVSQTTLFTAVKASKWLGVDASWFVPSIMGIGVSLVTSYIYFSYSWDLHNIKSKKNAHISQNFTSTTTAINNMIDVPQQAVQSKAIAENWDIDYTEDVLEEVTWDRLEDLKDGLDTEKRGEFFK